MSKKVIDWGNPTDKKFNLEKEWDGMPEFVQEKQEPYSQIIVRFNNEADLQEFANLIGQKLTNKTKSIWHPELERGALLKEMWVDPDEE